MLSAAARAGRQVSFVCFARLPAVTNPAQHHRVTPLTCGPWRLHTGLTSRCLRTSACPRRYLHPGAPSSPPEDPESSTSTDFSSRRSFKKSSPYVQDLRYREEDEVEPATPRSKTGRRNTPYWYFLQCKKLIKGNKLQEALDLFHHDMLKGERLRPEEFNYSVLIGGCGRAGQLKTAFKLYNDLKKRGLVASDATYTALFNACAESPFKSVGLQQALKLEQELRRKNYLLSTITYHALLKVHALNNHLQACIYTFKEMLDKGHAVTPETFHFLLMACMTDRDTGFRLALQVWRQMIWSEIEPDSQNYNLLLRTARDCGLGDPALASQVLLRSGQNRKSATKSGKVDIEVLEQQLFMQPKPDQHQSPDGQQDPSALISVGQNQDSQLPAEFAPNLLDLFEGKPGNVVSLGSVTNAADRLALIGGAESVLDKMAAKGLSPDRKTLTLLADMMEPVPRSMQTLLKVAKDHKVKLDTAFFNSAIRRAAKDGALKAAKDMLQLMRQHDVAVDIRTFGCLALGCNRQEQAVQLLSDTEKAGFNPNLHIFSTLIARAARRLDYVYLKMILKTMKDLNVWPNELIIRQLEFAAQYPPDYDQYKSRNNYLVQIDGFRGYYQQWLKEMPAVDGHGQQEALECSKATGLIGDGSEAQRTDSDGRAAVRKFSFRKKKSSSDRHADPDDVPGVRGQQ